MIRAVLLDIDDTLLDFDGYVKQSMRDGFAHFSLGEYDEEMFSVFKKINTSLWHRLENGEISFEELKRVRWSMVFNELGIDFDGVCFEDFFRKALYYSAIPVDGARDLLCYLSKRYPLYTASNGPYEQQMNRLKVGGLDSFFQGHFISERVGFSKPSYEFFDHCYCHVKAQIPEIMPDEIMMIGDSLTSDMKGAKAYGMQTCYFDKKMAGNVACERYDYYVSNLSDMKEIL